jgi:hypothetical protein
MTDFFWGEAGFALIIAACALILHVTKGWDSQ